MAEVVFRLPSKGITYGYVEVRATPEELGDPGLLASPEALGALYAQFTYAFLKGEQAAVQAALSATADKYEAEAEADAEKLIVEKLGGATMANHAVGDTVTVAGMEFTKHSDAPWNKPAPQAQAKPWEKKAGASTAPVKRATIDFDDF
jgi:hypothetical protein